MKCFILAVGVMLCTGGNVDKQCVKDVVEGWSRDLLLAPHLIESVINDCTKEVQGCCSWHGGVDTCDYLTGKYLCNDGYMSSCQCSRPTIEHEM